MAQTLWPDVLAVVHDVRFEWSPGRRDRRYLNNRSAFDVALLGSDEAGQPSCVGIEVKYHEDMTQDPGSAGNPRYGEVAAASQVFRDPDAAALRALPLRQVWYDHLLALSMLGEGPDRMSRVRFVLLAPQINEAVTAVHTAYRQHVVDHDTYEHRTLEEVAATLRTLYEAPWVTDFHSRYLQATRTIDEGKT